MSTTINFIERPNLLPQFKCLKYIGAPIESDENYYYSFEINDFDSLFDSEGVIGFYEYIERVANGESFEYVTPDGVSKLLIHSINEYFVFEVVNNGESLILVSGALQDLVNRISQYKLEQELYYGFAWHMDKLKIYRVVKTLDTSKVPRSHVTLDVVNGLTEWWQTVGEYEGEDSEDDTPSEGEDEPNYDDLEFEFIESLNLTPTYCMPKCRTDLHFKYSEGTDFWDFNFDESFDVSNCTDLYEYFGRALNGEELEFVAPNGTSKLRIYNDNNGSIVFACEYDGKEIRITSAPIEEIAPIISMYRGMVEAYAGFATLGNEVWLYQLTHGLTSELEICRLTFIPFEGLTEWYESLGDVEDGGNDAPSDDEPTDNFVNVTNLHLTPEFRLAVLKDGIKCDVNIEDTYENASKYIDLNNATNLLEVFHYVVEHGEIRYVSSDGNCELSFFLHENGIYIKLQHGDIVDVVGRFISAENLPDVTEGFIGFAMRVDEENKITKLFLVEIEEEYGIYVGCGSDAEDVYEWYKAIPTSSEDTPSDNPTQPDDNPNDDYEFEDYEKPIPSSMKEYFWTDNVPKDLLITDGDVSVVDGKLKVENYKVKLTNSEIHQEEFSLIESLTDEETLTFGEASSAVCEFTFSGNVISLKGMRLKVYMYLDRNPEHMIRIGEYIVDSDTPTADRTKRQVTMYDDLSRVINSDVAEWYKSISYPITLRAFASSFFAHFGITIDNNEDLINGEMMLKKATINPEVLSGKDVLTCILQAFGCCGRIGRNGHFQFVYLPQSIKGKYPAIDLYPREDLFPQKPKGEYISKATYIPPCEYESYTVESITQLEIRDSDNAIGTTVGTPGNPYVISNNFLFYGMTDATRRIYAQNILGKIEKVMYVPFSVDINGNPCVEVGDAIRLNTTYDKVDSYVLHRRLHGIQGLRDTISSKGTQYQEQKVNDLSTRIASTEGKITTQIETLIDGMAIRIDEDGNIVTSAEIKASGIDFKTNKFCVSAKNFTLDENGNAWFGGKVQSTKVEDGMLSDTTIDGSVITQHLLGNGKEIIVELKNGGLNFYSSMEEAEGGFPVVRVALDGLYAPYVNIRNIEAMYINNGTPITSENIGSQTIGYATNADTANRANTADEAFEAHHLSSYYTTDYVNINSYGNFVPSSSGTMRCGGSQGKWSEVWAENGTIQTSDRNLKHDIEDIDERYVEFITKLMPKRFKMNSGNSNRFHMGFIAQDVEDLLAECGIESIEFAGLIKDVYKDDDGNDVEYYALRYSEFIAPLVTAWQRTEDKLNTLISTLKDKGVL